MPEQPTSNSPESQSQRWVKYGSNTVVVCAVAVALAALVVYAAERKDKRIDTTAAGLYSLKPQTLNLIENNKDPIQITSFYTKAKPGQGAYGTADTTNADPATGVDKQADVVADLLEEYRARGRNITVETIDPKLNPSKADALIEQVSDQYGGQVKKYKDFTTALPAKYDAIAKAAEAEKAKMQPLRQALPDTDQGQTISLVLASVGEVPTFLKQYQQAYQAALKQKPPDYKGVADSVSTNMQSLSTFLGQVGDEFAALKARPDVPPDVKHYVTDSGPTYQGLKKQADGLLAEVKGLGELKLDTLRDALHQDNAILVRGPRDWKVIRYDQVWKNDGRDLRGGASAAAVHPRFAGEQMITTAIVGLEQPTKPKVCFVRAGGPPLAETGGQFSSLAARLKDYNFDVTDKDLTGQWAMQAMQQQQPAAPEPADADIDDADWVVDGTQQQPQQNPMMQASPPPSIAAKVADHLTKGHHWVAGKKVPGGSAFVLAMPRGDNMAAALADFGITLRTDAIGVHPLIRTEGAAADTGDVINQVEKNPTIFPVRDWGESPVTNTLRGLPGVLLYPVPVRTAAAAGATVTPLVPIPGAPDSPPSWGEIDFTSIESGPTFDKATDLPGPLFAAATSEKADGSRVLVMGSGPSFEGADVGSLNRSIVDFPDPELLARGVVAPKFPGNGEFFMNGCFWLAHQESMIAISPAAMTVSRIAPMTHAGQGFWHVGVLLIGLPGLVLAAGVAAYLSRRD